MKQRTSDLPLSFYVVSLASFLFQLARHTTQPIFTIYVLDMGASLTQVGLILSIQSTLMMMVRIPLTVVADRIGHNKMFIIAFVIQASTSILYAIAPNPSWLYFIPIYQIIASGSFNQLAMSTASNLAPVNKQGDALGRYMTFMSLGMFVGPVIAGSLMNFINYRQLYLVTSLFPTIGLGLFLMFMQKREDPESLHEIKGEDLSSTLSTLKIILRDRNIVVLTLIRTAYSMSNTVFTSLFTVFAIQDLGFTPALASFLYSIIGFFNAFIKFPAGRISDTLGAKKVLITTFAALILVYITISYVKGIVPILVCLVFFGACWGTRAVTEWATLANSVTNETKTIAMSYLGSIWGVGATLGSIMVSLVGETLPFTLIFLILAAINVPTLPAIAIMKEKEVNS